MRESAALPDDIRMHYRDVRNRLWAPKPIKQAPPQPKGVIRYAEPIGPKRPFAWQLRWPVTEDEALALSIVRQVTARTPYTEECVFGQSRQKAVVALRHKAMWRVSRELGWSLSRIGRFFGRDHTSCLHAINKLNGLPRKGTKA